MPAGRAERPRAELVARQPLPRVRTPRRGLHRRTPVFLVARDGSGLRRIASGGTDHPPAWSPDGTRLAFRSHRWLTVVTSRGAGLDQLARDGDAPSWSPDGSRIAYTRWGALHVIGVDGAGDRLLATGVTPDARPSWSPDGRELVYDGDDGEIHVVDVHTRANRVVAAHPASDWDPIWAGATGTILFVSERTDALQLWSATHGGRVRQETHGPDATESPASSRSGFALAFVRYGAAVPRMHYRPADGARHYRISRDRHVFGPPVFSLDGRFLAWTARGHCFRIGVYIYGPLDAPAVERRRTNSCEFRGTRRRDVIRGTRFSDLIDAGAGHDVVLTRDSYRDSVRCGPGRDRVEADRKDVIARDCERVHRP